MAHQRASLRVRRRGQPHWERPSPATSPSPLPALRSAAEDAKDGREPPSSRMQDAGCRMQDAGCRMQDAGCRMQGAGCRMQDAAQSVSAFGPCCCGQPWCHQGLGQGLGLPGPGPTGACPSLGPRLQSGRPRSPPRSPPGSRGDSAGVAPGATEPPAGGPRGPPRTARGGGETPVSG